MGVGKRTSGDVLPLNTRGLSVVQDFLVRSPRTALELQVTLNDQRWLWRYGNAEGAEPMVFEIGSVGKTFTTTLLELLIDRQKVSLSDPVARFYSELPWGRNVTLQQLATHTSGLPTNPFSRWQMTRRGRELAKGFREDDLIGFLKQFPVTRRVGNKAHYSNVGMALLGRILGDVCGQP